MKLARRHAPRRRQQGAALLTAMVIVTLVATLATSMIWQQWRSVQVEAAERARTQSSWILSGALDWARLILREDARGSAGATRLDQPWATPLAEARLSTFLAADKGQSGTPGDDDNAGPDAFLSGAITDAQSRYNLRNLLEQDNKVSPGELEVLGRLCEMAGVSPSVATQLADGLLRAAQADANAAGTAGPPAPLMPHSFDQLGWLGPDAATLARLEPFVTLLPARTVVNANTAPREVLAAVLEGMDLASAERLVQIRQRAPFKGIADVQTALPTGVTLDPKRLGISSQFFVVTGRLRVDQRVLEERSLVERKGLEVIPLRRERLQRQATGPL